MISNTSHLSDSRSDEFENTYSQKSDNRAREFGDSKGFPS